MAAANDTLVYVLSKTCFCGWKLIPPNPLLLKREGGVRFEELKIVMKPSSDGYSVNGRCDKEVKPFA